MKKIAVVVDSKNTQNHQWTLFPLFLKDFSKKFNLTSSFIGLENYDFVIFTSINDFLIKKITDLKIKEFGFILDGKVDWSNYYKILFEAKFVFAISGDAGVSKINNVQVFDKIVIPKKEKFGDSLFLTDEDDLNYVYQKLIDGTLDFSKLFVLYKNDGVLIKNSQFFIDQFRKISVDLVPVFTSPATIDALLNSNVEYLSRFDNGEGVFFHNKIGTSLDTLIDSIFNEIESKSTEDVKVEPFVNIVCFRPTYLFLDLVRRFEKVGCVHSDFPLKGASSYIWMRPQEIWHYEFLLENKKHKEISVTYQRSFTEENSREENLQKIMNKSVAIHHGTCFEPLYQFDYEKLAISLRRVNKVIGVCEFDECYGPSAPIANKNNYSFVPIGYDHNLFNESVSKKEELKPKEKIKIGFVGRAYGTNDKKQLSLSRLSEPKGYRKGGDILLDIMLRLKALNIPIELHILGQNWEDLVDDLNRFGIDFVYYARDKNITYEDYPKIYSLMDVLLITARCEGGPVSAIEALSLGVKVVSTNVGVVQYLSSIFSENKSCISIDYDKKWHITDKEAFVKEINCMYENGRSLKEIQECKKIVEKFTTDYWVKEIYNNALSILN
ncbi:glycosyltransferase [Comamonas sp. NoAH]|uniref:glycosyltransferase n=1 Tax=Comamonas halotolerans TaxID=3041496 RepID=UPI0024E0DFBA|nr:glycosyltransferase [Comamonas sp. NoAH]